MAEFGKFSEKCQNAINFARKEAKNMKHSYIGTEHLLLGILRESTGLGAQVLNSCGVDYEKAKKVVLEMIPLGHNDNDDLVFAPKLKKVIEYSNEVAMEAGKSFIGTHHILIGMLRVEDCGGFLALTRMNVEFSKLNDHLIKIIGEDNEYIDNKDINIKVYDKYTTNLNDEAKKGNIDPVIGRDDEIKRILQVLSRRTKNNPVLIGEPGVGKTAIVEGMAKAIVEKEVPDYLKNIVIRRVNMSTLLAGAKYRGDFEERLDNILENAEKDLSTILFFDEMHSVIGAGASEGSLDASNILKPYLTKGKLRLIGATTTKEYRKYIEKDNAFERRLMPITVSEPSIEQTVKILRGIRQKYEDFHDLRISDEAIDLAVNLTDRYITDRFLPDKAIDVIDEAASRLNLSHSKKAVFRYEYQKQLDELQIEKEMAVREKDFETAARLRDKQNDIRALYDRKEEEFKNLSPNILTSDEIRAIVSEWSKVPITKMTLEETDSLVNLDINLKKMVKGQDEAIDIITRAIKRARIGLKDDKKPVGSFMFVGSTGVGKTYLARSLAKELFGKEESLIRLDMSEYMEKHSISKLIGSPPGYVGYEEEGQLTDKIRTNPYSVVLFDEIEKAHPDVFNILLQILDEGRLTDSKGRVVSFKDAVIIMTSNEGSTDLNKGSTMGFSIGNSKMFEYEKMKETINEALKSKFRPEFLNRIDDVIIFNKLDKKEIKQIVLLILDKVSLRLHNMNINVKFTDKLVEYIAKNNFSTEYGARPLQRAVTKEVEDIIAEKILHGEISINSSIIVDYNDRVELKTVEEVKDEEKYSLQM